MVLIFCNSSVDLWHMLYISLSIQPRRSKCSPKVCNFPSSGAISNLEVVYLWYPIRASHSYRDPQALRWWAPTARALAREIWLSIGGEVNHFPHSLFSGIMIPTSTSPRSVVDRCGVGGLRLWATWHSSGDRRSIGRVIDPLSDVSIVPTCKTEKCEVFPLAK